MFTFCSRRLVKNALSLRYTFSSKITPVDDGQTENKVEESLSTVPNSKKEIIIDRFAMTPHQYYLTQGRHLERPYTGHTWYEGRVGYYHCAICDSKLFSFDDKYDSNNGIGSFWKSQDQKVEIVEETPENRVEVDVINQIVQEDNKKDKKHLQCRECKSFLGVLFFDGPLPTYLRYHVNGGSLKFKEKEWWTDPYQAKLERTELYKQNLRKEKRKSFAQLPDELQSEIKEDEQEEVVQQTDDWQKRRLRQDLYTPKKLTIPGRRKIR